MYVIKRKGNLQKFSKNKIVKGCKKSGASAKVAKKVANRVAKSIAISTRTIGMETIKALKKYDKKTAASFQKYFNKKWKKRKKR